MSITPDKSRSGHVPYRNPSPRLLICNRPWPKRPPCSAAPWPRPVPFNPPPKVVKTGPYQYVRNPMLTGVFLILFGIGVGVNSFSLLFFFTPLYILINVWELKKIEEPELMRRLGDEYIDYRSQTPMFIPRWGKKI